MGFFFWPLGVFFCASRRSWEPLGEPPSPPPVALFPSQIIFVLPGTGCPSRLQSRHESTDALSIGGTSGTNNVKASGKPDKS
eukprot:488987-Pyramimonas_sp.AAC.1